MVSTRSGRVVSSSDAPVGRVSRSRAKSKTDTLAEELTVDIGQPEVTSPAPLIATPVTGFAASPAAFEGFGSPLLAQHTNETPMQQDIFGTPLQERVVKTVGRGAPQTPSARPAVPATPGRPAQEVHQAASAPLPDDGGSEETEPFASSEDEPVAPDSQSKEQRFVPTSNATGGRPARGSGALFAFFTLSSILLTALIAVLLGPCTDPELFTLVQSPTHERICKTVVNLQTEASKRGADLTWRLRAEAADVAAAVHAKLPPAALELLGQALETVQQAHSAAWDFVKHAGQQAEPHLTLIQRQIQEAYQQTSRLMFTRVAPRVREALSRVTEMFPAPSSAAPSEVVAQSSISASPDGTGIACLRLVDLLTMLDQEEQVQQYAQALWDAAAEQVTRKHKAVAWILACRHAGECSATYSSLYYAATSVLQIDSPYFSAPDSAGALQSELVKFLRAYPSGLVVVTQPERMHPNSVAVLNAAMSEGGHLQMDGAPITTEQALYVFIVQDPSATVYDADGVKDRLCASITAMDAEAISTPAIVLSFRRRLDAVLPVLPRPLESSQPDTA